MPLKKYCSYETSKKWQIVVSVFIGCSLISGLVILLIIGGTIYNDERPKELRYQSDTCGVVNKDIRVYWCSARSSRHRCYGPAWYVRRKHYESSNATIVGANRFRAIGDAYRKVIQYQVNLI